LFDGAWVAPSAFVAAVGSSKPDSRELDDTLLRRAAAICVEWRDQTLVEAGDLVLCAPEVIERAVVIELGEALAARHPFRRAPHDIVVFKSVGVGLADLATAELAYRKAYSGREAAA
jgi:ornithine cyclodeaminase